MAKKKLTVIDENPQDKTTLQLIEIINKLTKERDNLAQEKRWHDSTIMVNKSLENAAGEWNTITLMGHAYIINEGYNIYVRCGSVHYDIRIGERNQFIDEENIYLKKHDVQKGDIVMVFGHIFYHVAHDDESRQGGSMGVDTIVVRPHRIQVISRADNTLILPEEKPRQ